MSQTTNQKIPAKITTVKNELLSLGIALVVLAVILKIAFYKDAVWNIIKMAGALFWLYVLPGYAILLHWSESLDFLERLIIGSVIGGVVVAALSYYVGLMGIHLKYHGIILPVIIIGVSLGVMYLPSFSLKRKEIVK